MLTNAPQERKTFAFFINAEKLYQTDEFGIKYKTGYGL